MPDIDVVVLTDSRYLEDSHTDSYKHNVFYEDQLVVEALRKKGLKTMRLAWDDSTFDWYRTESALFRTTWDYFERFAEFSNWLTKVSQHTRLFNSETMIRWNIDKHYLIDLSDKGVHIAESHFIEKGTSITLEKLHQDLNWDETVLKPCVSGAARHTYRMNRGDCESHESVFQDLIANEGMMLQPFQQRIVSEGELSMMVFDGKFSHAVLKMAKSGDFRVQDDFGGSVHEYHPTADEIDFAESAVRACPELPVYARVDIFKDNEGRTALSELELIEPELWFRRCPEAADLLATGITQRLQQAST